MIPPLTVTFVQTDLQWEQPAANRTAIEAHLQRSLTQPTDVLILPEMFTTGFTMNAAPYAETMQGETIQWLHTLSQHYQAAVTGSLIITENGQYFNRLVWVQPDGAVYHYDKKHLFVLSKEQEVYAAGATRTLIVYKGWRICPLICYDLRFPVWSSNTLRYDVLLYVANFPQARRYAWQQLLIGRAIENQSYVIGVNRIGTDGKGIAYAGDSMIIDYEGSAYAAVAHQAAVFTATLSYQKLQAFRQQYPFLAHELDFL